MTKSKIGNALITAAAVLITWRGFAQSRPTPTSDFTRVEKQFDSLPLCLLKVWLALKKQDGSWRINWRLSLTPPPGNRSE